MEKKMMKIYGNDTKLFKYKNENAYFYVSYESCKNHVIWVNVYVIFAQIKEIVALEII